MAAFDQATFGAEEKSLHRALRENMGKGAEALDDVVNKMEVASERLRREEVERFFA